MKPDFMKALGQILTLGLVGLLLQGCFDKQRRYVGPKPNDVYNHIIDYDIVHHSRHKGVVVVKYELRGVYGPNKVHLANSNNLSSVLEMNLVSFPEAMELSMDENELEALELKAERHLQNYFGAQKEVHVYTMKRVVDHEMTYFFLDIKHPDRDLSAADYLVSRGLLQVDHEVAKLSGMTYLIELENDARRQDLGIWRNLQTVK